MILCGFLISKRKEIGNTNYVLFHKKLSNGETFNVELRVIVLIHLYDRVFLRMLYGLYYAVLCWKLLSQEIILNLARKLYIIFMQQYI